MTEPDRPSQQADAAMLQMQGIVVRFGSLVANDQISLDVQRGEIHALLGENGAGKTTLMKVLAGLVRSQAGRILLNGQTVDISSAIEAMRFGIGMVHQHFMLIPTLTVAENVSIGLRSAGFPFPRLDIVSRDLRALAERYQLHVDPDARVLQLSVGAQQRVEIIKALYRGAKILVLDEPTAVLTPQETAGLFNVLRALAAQGTAIVFISHKLREIMAISDRVTILRQGRWVATQRTQDTNEAELARLMVGREVQTARISGGNTGEKPVVLSTEGLSFVNERGLPVVKEVSLQLKAGDILGIAGVDGNGQSELAQVLAGLRRPTGGKVWLDGKDITHATPARRIQLGLAHIPEDRQLTGLILDLSIADNSVLELVGQAPYSRRGLLNLAAIQGLANQLVSAYDIRSRSARQAVGALSGGNQQKLLLARELFRNPRVILAVQPSRGLDIGAMEYVHRQLLEQRKRGCAILMISTELDEILALSDRVGVMYEGRFVRTVPRQQARVDTLGLLMAGKEA